MSSITTSGTTTSSSAHTIARSPQHGQYVLHFCCNDVSGIVAAVTDFLKKNDGFILESAQFGDQTTGQFFMRCAFDIRTDGTADNPQTLENLREGFAEIATHFNMQWQLCDMRTRPNMMILVSKHEHCLNDLLHRHRTGTLPVHISAVVSNHEALRGLVEWHGINYHYFPITPETKPKQEAKIKLLCDIEEIDLVVLARYMQVLSPELVSHLQGRAINIHHSFLPGFKGAKPYYQAHERGVKLIGATAHYVSNDLDEGPIIEQEVTRVDHTHYPADLQAIGRDMECTVLARALKFHLEHRVLPNGNKTVVFR